MSRLQSRFLELGVLLIVVALPVFVNPFGLNPYEPSKTGLFWVLVTVLCLVAVFTGVFRQVNKQIPLRRLRQPIGAYLTKLHHPLALPVLVYGLVYLLSALFSVDIRASFLGLGDRGGAVTSAMLLAFFFLVSASFRSWQQLDNLLTALIFGSIPVAFYGWIQFLGLDGLYGQAGSGLGVFIHATFARHLYLGNYLAMIVPFTITRVADNSLPLSRRFRFGLILALQLACLFLSLSRSAYLALFVGLIVFYALWAGRRGLRRLSLVLLVLALIGPMLLLIIHTAVPTLYERAGFEQALGELDILRSKSNLFRIITWKRALEMIPERWLLGYGPETFPLFQPPASSGHRPEDPEQLYPLYDPHNIFLYQLTALGVAGLLSFSWILIRFFKTTFSIFRRETSRPYRWFLAAVISSVVIYLVQAQLNPEAIVLAMLFWLLLAVGAGAITALPETREAIRIQPRDWQLEWGD